MLGLISHDIAPKSGTALHRCKASSSPGTSPSKLDKEASIGRLDRCLIATGTSSAITVLWRRSFFIVPKPTTPRALMATGTGSAATKQLHRTETNGSPNTESTKHRRDACNSCRCGGWKYWKWWKCMQTVVGNFGSRPQPKPKCRLYCFQSSSQTPQSHHPNSSRTQGCGCILNLLASCIFITCPTLPNKVLAIVGQNIVFPGALIGPVNHVACPKEYLQRLFTRSRLGQNSWPCTIFTFKVSLRRPDHPHFIRGTSNQTDMDVACTVGGMCIKNSVVFKA